MQLSNRVTTKGPYRASSPPVRTPRKMTVVHCQEKTGRGEWHLQGSYYGLMPTACVYAIGRGVSFRACRASRRRRENRCAPSALLLAIAEWMRETRLSPNLTRTFVTLPQSSLIRLLVLDDVRGRGRVHTRKSLRHRALLPVCRSLLQP